MRDSLRRGKLLLAALLPVVGVLLLPATASAFSGAGAGTPLSPYLITTCAQFEEIDGDLSASYKLANDIDCTGVMYTPIGSSGGFSGTLDGNHHVISHVTFNNPSTNNVGIFNNINGGSVSNLTVSHAAISGNSYVGSLAGVANGFGSVTGVAVTDSTVTGQQTVGGFIGSMNQFSVDHSYTSNTPVNGYLTSGYANDIGGFVGDTSYADISSSFVSGGTVTGNSYNNDYSAYVAGFIAHDGGQSTVTDTYTTADVSGYGPVGGFIGVLNNSSIGSSYATGAVSGYINVGGFAGDAYDGTIDYSFSSGAVSGTGNFGGFIGNTSQSAPATIINNYWDVTGSGQTNCIGFLDISGVTCTGVNTASAQPTYFFNNHSSAPLNSWAFPSTWITQATASPVLAYSLPTVTSVSVVRGSTQLTPSWQPPAYAGSLLSYSLAYKLRGSSNAWTTVTISPTTATTGTVSGLLPSTWYSFELAYTSTIGTSPWQDFDSITAAAASTPTIPTVTTTSSSATTTPTAAAASSSLVDDLVSGTVVATPTTTVTSTSDQAAPQPKSVQLDSTKKSSITYYWLTLAVLLVGFLVVKLRPHKG